MMSQSDFLKNAGRWGGSDVAKRHYRAAVLSNPFYVVHHIKRILVQPGRRPPARRSANISPSSWTIRASPRRSMPAWSRPRTARATTSSGPAATAIEAGPTKELRSRAGLRHVHGCAADQEYGDQDGRMSGSSALQILIRSFPASAGALARDLLGALPPARRKGSLTLVRDGLPNLPRPGSSPGLVQAG